MNPAAAVSRNKDTRAHLSFLDGLRGLSAAAVVVYHLWIKHLVPEIRDAGRSAPLWLRSARDFDPYMWAQYAVSVFIVLSGFCLMLPVVRDGRFSGGIAGFFVRRARRILPPYYAALAMAWCVIALFHLQIQREPTHWDLNLPAFSPEAVVSHLLLIQNMTSHWAFQICGPLWSVPPECQIYMLFPLLLLPVWRRLGNGVLIVASVAVGALLTHCVPSSALYFTGLFAMGMAAADLYHRASAAAAGAERGAQQLPAAPILLLVGGLCALGAAILATVGAGWAQGHKGIAASLAGGACACFLVVCGRDRDAGRKTAALRLLECRPAVWLGSWSYSLYLTHTMGLAAAHIAIRSCHPSLSAAIPLIVAVALPLALCCSYLFHLAFERPFMTGKKRPSVRLVPAHLSEDRMYARPEQMSKTESRHG